MPANAFEAEKSAIEPRPEQMLQVGVQRAEIRAVVCGCLKNVSAQGDQRFRAARRRIESPDEFLARRLDGRGKRGQGSRAGRTFVRGCSPVDRKMVSIEVK